MRQNDFRGATLKEAIGKATAFYRDPKGIEQKQIAEVYAGPLFWGPWVDIFTQFGVVGPNNDKHVTRLMVSFNSITGDSSFNVQIKGGDELVNAIGPGSAVVEITGNVATTIRIRAKSHSYALAIDVNVSG